ncbi:MAG: flagellar hook-basal body complex protein, partial [Proteobacteria bacterium]|nr:flagellar hook-basal body complex protein [Pseudomonadota bacterium]
MYAGVAGLSSQSNKLGVISDNIANVNTIGYKYVSAVFETLVTSASGVTAYSPGGVLGGNSQLVDKQGLLQTTSSPTDIAISGGGFFIVNEKSDKSGQVLYTRAGSFTQDSDGNFRNNANLFLQAWPLDRDGRLPGAPGNV